MKKNDFVDGRIKEIFLRFLVAVFLLVGVCAARSEEKPNVLLILVDDAGYNDFGFMGSPDLESPNIDQLAKEGTVFSDAHVTASVCSPSRAGLITGRYQQRFGHECNVPPDNQGMDPDETTMGDALREAGYRTSIIGKWHLGNRTVYHPLNRGFDEFFGFLEGGRSFFPDDRIDEPTSYRAVLDGRNQIDFKGYLTDVFTDRAIDYIDRNKGSPWFLFLSYNAVHTPMDAKDEHLDRFAGHPRQQLAAMTWSLDENIGRLVEAMDASGELDDTLIFFLSDNGGAGEHNNQSSNRPLKGWKGNKYEGGHRVPFFITWKGEVPAGKTFKGLTSSLDIFATSIAAAGLKRTPGLSLDGVDLIPFLRSEKAGIPHDTLYWRKDRMAAARLENYKLVRLEGFGHCLYDLSQDLGETNDLSIERPDLLRSMKENLAAWEAEMGWPRWYEGEEWNAVTYEINRALMENREPQYLSPHQMQEYRKKTHVSVKD
ncbi:sulfatase-like hydrolase/transferase [Puniceicoccaceae bacterium K14]|nr:sulfatase-like hydrolase/transferase [Puniceicoccaceae bacterium K14]